MQDENKTADINQQLRNMVKGFLIFQLILITANCMFAYIVANSNQMAIDSLYNYSLLKYILINEHAGSFKYTLFSNFNFFDIVLIVIYPCVFCVLIATSIEFNNEKLKAILVKFSCIVSDTLLIWQGFIMGSMVLITYLFTSLYNQEFGNNINASHYMNCTTNAPCNYVVQNLTTEGFKNKEVMSEILAINNLSRTVTDKVKNPNFEKISNVKQGKTSITFDYTTNKQYLLSLKNITGKESSDITIPKDSVINADFYYGASDIDNNNCYVKVNAIKYGNSSLNLITLLSEVETNNQFSYFNALGKEQQAKYNNGFATVYLSKENCEKYKRVLQVKK